MDLKKILNDFEVAAGKGLTPGDMSTVSAIAKVRFLGSIAISLDELVRRGDASAVRKIQLPSKRSR